MQADPDIHINNNKKKIRLDSHLPLPDTHCQLFKKKYLVEKSSIKKKNK